MPVGGKRPGAGRPKGSKDRATREAGAQLAELARAKTKQALDALVKVATKGESEAARVSAATAILDRGYGRPPQAVTGPGGGAIPVNLSGLSDEQLRRLHELLAAAGLAGAGGNGDPPAGG